MMIHARTNSWYYVEEKEKPRKNRNRIFCWNYCSNSWRTIDKKNLSSCYRNILLFCSQQNSWNIKYNRHWKIEYRI
jgi:hypothetical protein